MLVLRIRAGSVLRRSRVLSFGLVRAKEGWAWIFSVTDEPNQICDRHVEYNSYASTIGQGCIFQLSSATHIFNQLRSPEGNSIAPYAPSNSREHNTFTVPSEKNALAAGSRSFEGEPILKVILAPALSRTSTTGACPFEAAWQHPTHDQCCCPGFGYLIWL